MALSTELKAGQMNAYIAAIGTSGKLVVVDAGGAALGTITFDATCAPTTATDTLTFSGFPKTGTGVTAGTAASAKITKADGTMVRDAITVGVAGSQAALILDSLSITTTLVINSAAIGHS